MTNRIAALAANLPRLTYPAAIAAATLGQCACGQLVTGIRYAADRDGSEATTNLPCGHPRGGAN